MIHNKISDVLNRHSTLTVIQQVFLLETLNRSEEIAPVEYKVRIVRDDVKKIMWSWGLESWDMVEIATLFETVIRPIEGEPGWFIVHCSGIEYGQTYDEWDAENFPVDRFLER